MDLRTGKTYETREAALAAGVPESDIAHVMIRARLEPFVEVSNKKYPVRHQGRRETTRRMKAMSEAGEA